MPTDIDRIELHSILWYIAYTSDSISNLDNGMRAKHCKYPFIRRCSISLISNHEYGSRAILLLITHLSQPLRFPISLRIVSSII